MLTFFISLNVKKRLDCTNWSHINWTKLKWTELDSNTKLKIALESSQEVGFIYRIVPWTEQNKWKELNSTGNYGRRCVHVYVRIYFLASIELIKTLWQYWLVSGFTKISSKIKHNFLVHPKLIYACINRVSIHNRKYQNSVSSPVKVMLAVVHAVGTGPVSHAWTRWRTACYSTVALVPPMSTMYVWRGIT